MHVYQFAGVSNTSRLYKRGIRICTGTGIGAALSTCIQSPYWYVAVTRLPSPCAAKRTHLLTRLPALALSFACAFCVLPSRYLIWIGTYTRSLRAALPPTPRD